MQMKKEHSTSAFYFVLKVGDSPGNVIAAMPDEELTEYLSHHHFSEQAQLYRANPDYLFRDITGEAILVPVGESEEQFDGTQDEIEKDINDSVVEMLQYGFMSEEEV